MLPTIKDGEIVDANTSLDRFMMKTVRRSSSRKNLFSADTHFSTHNHGHTSPVKPRNSAAYYLVWSLLATTAVVSVSVLFPSDPAVDPTSPTMHSRGIKEVDSTAAALGAPPHPSAPTLIIYVYSNSDPEYSRNLHFFVKHGMREGDGCDYVIIVQQVAGQANDDLPPLPSNARYVYHANECYDWGTFGWAIETGVVDPSKYTYLIFMNSSTRGPILAPYWPSFLHWSAIYTNKLTDKVKLVGSTISCEPAWRGADRSNEMRQIPHVQSYVIATDQVGLKVLQDNGEVFKCYSDMDDTIFNAELGSSLAMYDAGYTVDSLMLRYQGVDWTDHANWQCNAGLNPYAEFAYDGIELNPMEVVFVKVKDFLLDVGWTAPTWASTYDRWISSQGMTGVINSNAYAEDKDTYRLPKILALQKRDPNCFDFGFYMARSKDLPREMTRAAAWEHLILHGQFEGRVFRFVCKLMLPAGDSAAIGGTTLGVAAAAAADPVVAAIIHPQQPAAVAAAGDEPQAAAVEAAQQLEPGTGTDEQSAQAEAVGGEVADAEQKHVRVNIKVHARPAEVADAGVQPGAAALGGTTLGVDALQQANAAQAEVVPAGEAEAHPVPVNADAAAGAQAGMTAQARLRHV